MSVSFTGIKKAGSKLGYDSARQGVSIFEWGLAVLLLLFCVVSFHYADMSSIVDNSVLFAKSIYHGEFFHFYEYSIQHASTDWAANYEIPMYLIIALWNAPLLLIDLFTDVPYLESFYCIVWSKLLIFAFIGLTAFVIYRICIYVGLERRRAAFGAFLFTSSGLLMFLTLVVSQVEIIPIFFMVLGGYMFLQKKYRWFVVCFAVAIPLKMFAIFVFIPLVLLHEKKVLKILGYLLGGMSLSLLLKLIFINSLAYQYALGSNSKDAIGLMVNMGVDFGSGQLIPIFIALMVLICIYCYVKKDETLITRAMAISYLPLMVFGAFMVTYPVNSYWAVLIVPFFTLTVILSDKNLKTNIFLELAGCTALLVPRLISSISFDLLNENSAPMFLYHFFPLAEGRERKYSSILDFMDKAGITRYYGAFFAIFTACLIAFLILNWPNKIRKIGNTDRIEYSVIWCRLSISVVLVAVMTFSFLATVEKPSIDTTAQAVETMETNVMKNIPITQQITFDQDKTISELTLKFKNNAQNRINMGYISVSILDSQGNEIYRKDTGTSILMGGEDILYNLKNLQVKAGDVYTIKITGTPDKFGSSIAPMVTSELLYDNPLCIDGVPQDYNLYMKIR